MADEKSTQQTSSMSKGDDMPKPVTSRILNGINYLAWVQVVKVFLRGKRKLKLLTNDPPKTNPKYDNCMCEDSVMMGSLWQSMKPHIASTVEFCDPFRKIWDSISNSFSPQSNVSCVYELYE